MHANNSTAHSGSHLDNRVEVDYVEPDCPYFDPAWLLNHPDFPLASSATAQIEVTP